MPVIELETKFDAPIELVFDLSRSVDLHKISTSQTKEEAIAGKIKGMMELGDWVTWKARHLGFYQKLTSQITDMERPIFFADEMVKGAFKSFRHEHHFEDVGGATLLKDVFQYESPFGIFGKLADKIFLRDYMKKFLEYRNVVLKEFAESDKWKKIIQV